MKRSGVLLMCQLMLAMAVSAGTAEKTHLGVKVNAAGITTELQVYSPEIIRVVKYPASLNEMPR